MPKGRIGVLIEGVPTDGQIEEMLDGLGFEPEPLKEHAAGPPGHKHPADPEAAVEDEPPAADEQDEDPDAEVGGAIETLTVALANTFAMYLRAHVFHWNTVGPTFVSDHLYLDSLNGELFGAVDPLAEHIRALGGMAPSGIGEFADLSTVADPGTPEAKAPAMWEELLAANEEVVGSLELAFLAANETGDQGLLNFLADRLDHHAKHGWFLRSLLGKTA